VKITITLHIYKKINLKNNDLFGYQQHKF